MTLVQNNRLSICHKGYLFGYLCTIPANIAWLACSNALTRSHVSIALAGSPPQ